MKRLLIPSIVLAMAMLACSISPLPVSTQEATEPPASGENLPAGFITALNGQPVQLNFYNTSGASLGSINAPSLASAGTGNIFPAGGVSGGILPPIVYYTWNGNNLISNSNGAETVLANAAEFYGMTGVPGQSLIAYGTANLTGTGLDTSLFVGTPDSATSNGPVLTYNTKPNGAIIPLYIEVNDGVPSGVWFTKRMYGIGGDIVFDPSSGLFHLDLETGDVSEITLSDSPYSPSLSPDASWMAYRDQSLVDAGALTIRQITSGVTYSFPLLADSDRGAGDGVFSNDLLHIAWMEGHGWMMAEVPDFRSTVRIGSIDGSILDDYPASSFTAAAGFNVTTARPVGWLDDQSVLVQITGEDWTQSCVIKLGLDGSMNLLANGTFTGFLFP